MNLNPLLMTDGYKAAHRQMYPKGTTMVYSNYTCRSVSRMPTGAEDVVVFGTQYMLSYLQSLWQKNFFYRQRSEVCQEAARYLSSYLGAEYSVKHFEELHKLGYLPIEVRALEEGSVVKEGVPLFTIRNTHPDFFWITNFLETLISTLIWKPVHSASLAYAYKKLLLRYAQETGGDVGFVDFQGHDFSFRGMQSPESAIASGLGFLTCFKGTDTIPTLQAAATYYRTEAAGFSVPASEHSVMSAHGKADEIETFKQLLDLFPKGILSVVSDTWNLWNVCTDYLPRLKEQIMSRDGKLVIRPDSGDPVDILCGINTCPALNSEIKEFKQLRNGRYGDRTISESEFAGVVELLWNTFGGTEVDGYKHLDSHIGVIYGDSITLERAEQICERLKAKGFASTNVVLGVGSYSMGYATRDSQGGAMKSTYCEVNGEGREIFKDPVTDDGTKKSAKGLVWVDKDFKLHDQATWDDVKSDKNIMKVVYKDGFLIDSVTLTQIREKISKELSFSNPQVPTLNLL